MNCCAGEQHGFRKAENIQDALDGEFYFFGKVLGFTPADNIKEVQNSQALFVFHIFKLEKKNPCKLSLKMIFKKKSNFEKCNSWRKKKVGKFYWGWGGGGSREGMRQNAEVICQ